MSKGPEIRKLSHHDLPRLCPSPSPASLPFPQAGRRAPGPALWWVSGRGEEVRWDFGQLQELSQRTANVLAGACGLQRGDRVAVVLPRVPEWWLVTLGCMRAGG